MTWSRSITKRQRSRPSSPSSPQITPACRSVSAVSRTKKGATDRGELDMGRLLLSQMRGDARREPAVMRPAPHDTWKTDNTHHRHVPSCAEHDAAQEPCGA